MPLLQWTQAHRANLTPTVPFDLDRHRYLRGIYEDTTRERIIMKSGQGGASEYCISYALHACDVRLMSVLYLLPTIGDISDFSQMRIGPALEASEYLADIVHDVDRVRLKRIRHQNLVLRGAQVKPGSTVGERRGASQLKSVPVDLVVYDEFDEMPIGVEPLAEKRLGHSAHKEQLWVSTPTYPGLGIHSKWQISDQRLWFVPCAACGQRQALTIDHVVIESDDLGRPVTWHGQNDDRAFCACEKCGSEIDRLAIGEWVPTYPDRQIAGYSFNKLVTAQNDPLAVVRGLQTTDESKRQESFNQDLALPYRPRGAGITDEILLACRRPYSHGVAPGASGVTMGIDVGRVLNVVIRAKPDPHTGERRQLYAGETMTFEDAGRLVRQYGVSLCVIDALPETREARHFQESLPAGIVWLCYYHTGARGTIQADPAVWNWKEYTVTADRTRTLDETMSRFMEGMNTLPAHIEAVTDYETQLKAPVRTQRRQPDGTVVSQYVEVGADHYAHAENYATIASMQAVAGAAAVMR